MKNSDRYIIQMFFFCESHTGVEQYVNDDRIFRFCFVKPTKHKWELKISELSVDKNR